MMSKSDQRNIILRLVLLGVFFWIGLSSASSNGISKSSDFQKVSYQDLTSSQKCIAGYSSYDLGSSPGLFRQPAGFRKATFSTSKLRCDETAVALRLLHCQQIYLTIKGAWLQTHYPFLKPIRKYPSFTDRIS